MRITSCDVTPTSVSRQYRYVVISNVTCFWIVEDTQSSGGGGAKGLNETKLYVLYFTQSTSCIYRIIFYHIISYRIVSYHIISYHTISHRIASYHIIIILYYIIRDTFLVVGDLCPSMFRHNIAEDSPISASAAAPPPSSLSPHRPSTGTITYAKWRP